jgi:hypothetical protein
VVAQLFVLRWLADLGPPEAAGRYNGLGVLAFTIITARACSIRRPFHVLG